jgi:hypothetical protein
MAPDHDGAAAMLSWPFRSDDDSPAGLTVRLEYTWLGGTPALDGKAPVHGIRSSDRIH